MEFRVEQFSDQFSSPTATVGSPLTHASGPMQVNTSPPSEMEVMGRIGNLKSYKIDGLLDCHYPSSRLMAKWQHGVNKTPRIN